MGMGMAARVGGARRGKSEVESRGGKGSGAREEEASLGPRASSALPRRSGSPPGVEGLSTASVLPRARPPRTGPSAAPLLRACTTVNVEHQPLGRKRSAGWSLAAGRAASRDN